MAWVLGDITVKVALDPGYRELCKAENLWWLLEHDLPEVKHLLTFVANDIALTVYQVAACIDKTTLVVHSLACSWVGLQNDILGGWIFGELAYDLFDVI